MTLASLYLVIAIISAILALVFGVMEKQYDRITVKMIVNNHTADMIDNRKNNYGNIANVFAALLIVMTFMIVLAGLT